MVDMTGNMTSAERDYSHLATLAITCPRCGATRGQNCRSTGGGNPATVADHKPRRDRIQHWTHAQLQYAGRIAVESRPWGGNIPEVADEVWAELETAAAPMPEPKTKPSNPRTVNLSGPQRVLVEQLAANGGRGYAPTTHFHGDASRRRTSNALEAKGIITTWCGDGYERPIELTAFGWAVYAQHPGIVRNQEQDLAA